MYSIEPVQPLLTRSRSGAVRGRELRNGQEVRTWPAQYQPEDSFRGHFEFGLKYDRLNFEFFSRLFEVVDPRDVAEWVVSEPTGQYARRTGFFYEWFADRRLEVPDTPANVGYVDAIDSNLYLAAANGMRSRRWRVRDNMPGPRQFCPLVHLGPAEDRGWIYDVSAGVRHLDETYGPELLMRCSAWLTFRESRASFAIEHEAEDGDRVKRFAAAIGQYSGRLKDPLSHEDLLLLQRSVLGGAALRVGMRESPVFVGESTYRSQIVHYIAPDEAVVTEMLEALRQFEQRTRGADPVVRAAAVSFAFVYLHPLSDGNGRIHRFLINHLLAADGAVVSNVIVPVSATIAGSARGRADYDRVLEVFSRPLMQRYAQAYRFGDRRTCPDGVTTDFEFHAFEDARHAWRYTDLTEHVRYMSEVLKRTVEHEMVEEAELLRSNDRAREALKEILEMPDPDADRIIRSLKDNNWTVSGKLRKELPELFEEGNRHYERSPRLIEAVRQAFEGDDHR